MSSTVFETNEVQIVFVTPGAKEDETGGGHWPENGLLVLYVLEN